MVLVTCLFMGVLGLAGAQSRNPLGSHPRWPSAFTEVTRVQIPLGTPNQSMSYRNFSKELAVQRRYLASSGSCRLPCFARQQQLTHNLDVLSVAFEQLASRQTHWKHKGLELTSIWVDTLLLRNGCDGKRSQPSRWDGLTFDIKSGIILVSSAEQRCPQS